MFSLALIFAIQFKLFEKWRESNEIFIIHRNFHDGVMCFFCFGKRRCPTDFTGLSG